MELSAFEMFMGNLNAGYFCLAVFKGFFTNGLPFLLQKYVCSSKKIKFNVAIVNLISSFCLILPMLQKEKQNSLFAWLHMVSVHSRSQC